MRRAKLPAAAIATLAAAGAGALLVHDARGHDRLAPGTRVAGTDVGGMDVDAARALVPRARGAALARDLVLSHGDRRFRLERKVAAALAGPRADRTLDIPVRVTRRPRRTLAELRDRYPRVVAVSRPRKELRFYRRLRLVRKYQIAIGQAGFETRRGRYAVQSMQKDPAWHAPDKEWAGEFAGKTVPPGSPDNPLKARWIGFNAGEGIHGTADVASLGGRASHGCIRMSVRGVKDLYRRVRLGTPVFVL